METHQNSLLSLNGALLGAGSPQCPPQWRKDCGITRRRKLFLGAEFDRGAMVQDYLFVGPLMGRRKIFAAAPCKLSAARLQKGTAHQEYADSDALQRAGKQKNSKRRDR